MSHIVITLKDGEQIDSNKKLKTYSEHGEWSIFHTFEFEDVEKVVGPPWNRKTIVEKVRNKLFRFQIRTADIKWLEVVD